MGKPRIDIPTDTIAAFCRRNRIRRLAVFGSVLRDDFRPDSNVDVLVEWSCVEHSPNHIRRRHILSGLESVHVGG